MVNTPLLLFTILSGPTYSVDTVIFVPGLAPFNNCDAFALILLPDPVGGAPGFPGIINSQLLKVNCAFNGISGGYLANKFVSFLDILPPEAAVPKKISGFGNALTLNLKVPNEALFSDKLDLP